MEWRDRPGYEEDFLGPLKYDMITRANNEMKLEQQKLAHANSLELLSFDLPS